MNTRSATLNSSLTTPSPIGAKIEKEVTVKKRQRYIWPEAQFVRLMHRFRCEVRVAYVSLFNIDDLEALAYRGVQARERELTACHQIIEAHVAMLTEKLHMEEAQSPWRSAARQLSTTVLIPQPTYAKSRMVARLSLRLFLALAVARARNDLNVL